MSYPFVYNIIINKGKHHDILKQSSFYRLLASDAISMAYSSCCIVLC